MRYFRSFWRRSPNETLGLRTRNFESISTNSERAAIGSNAQSSCKVSLNCQNSWGLPVFLHFVGVKRVGLLHPQV
jgi:hypothetical protein